MKGFALLVSLLLLLLLTLFGFSLLLMAGSHYGSARSLFENENAKLACESALWSIVHGYNSEAEEFRVAHPHGKYWSELQPFDWNGYRIEVVVSSPWKSEGQNRVSLSARRGQYFAQIDADLRQRRLEDFALFSDATQMLSTSSVFDGLVFVRGELSLFQPEVRFRDIVQADVFPADFASYDRKVVSNLNYPKLDQILQSQILLNPGTPQDLATFRDGDDYVIQLDQVRLVKDSGTWFLQYKGKTVSTGTVLYFDDTVYVTQANRNSYFHISSKPSQPLYLISTQNIVIESSLSFLESADAEHPLCLISNKMNLSASGPRAYVIDAFLLALENEGSAMTIEAGETILNFDEKKWAIGEINASSFLTDSYKKITLIAAIESDQKAVWFRGPLAQRAPFQAPEDLAEMHFESSPWLYPFIPPLRFVYIVEGSREWR